VPCLIPDQIYCGDCRDLLTQIVPGSVDLVVTSPPYGVGKSYETNVSVAAWESLLTDAVVLSATALKPGGFLVLNLADIRCFPAPELGEQQTEYPHRRSSPVTKEAILELLAREPWLSEAEIGRRFGISAQTVARRLRGHLARGRSGGPKRPPTRVRLVAGLVDAIAVQAGLFVESARCWAKTPNWHGSPSAASGSYRGVDEWEHLFFLAKPGPVVFKPERLTRQEWAAWGNRSLWSVSSVAANRIHPAMWPVEIPRRVIRLLTDPGDLVCDPFAGSATTGLACLELGRHYFAFEKDASFAAAAKERLRRQAEPHAGR
jgi:site-specific DNA-methyltransferase (adenine-specific)